MQEKLICALCDKPVENVRYYHTYGNNTVTRVVYCHGKQETETISLQNYNPQQVLTDSRYKEKIVSVFLKGE